MSDPRRILDDPEGEFATELLRSIDRDGPPPEARKRTLAALGLGGAAVLHTAQLQAAGAAATSASSGSSSGLLAWSLAIKWGALGAGVGAVVLALGGTVLRTASPHPESAGIERANAATLKGPLKTSAVDRSARSQVAPEADELPPSASPSASQGEAFPARASAAAEVRTSLPRGALPRPAPSSTGDKFSLAAEVTALDQARQAVQRRETVRAIALLDAYQGQFPEGALKQEAAVLRVQALQASGRTQEARELGQSLIRKDPTGPHTQRIHSLLSEPATP